MILSCQDLSRGIYGYAPRLAVNIHPYERHPRKISPRTGALISHGSMHESSGYMIPEAVVNQLLAMDGYDRILAADQQAKKLGIAPEDLLTQLSHIEAERAKGSDTEVSADEYAADLSGDTNEAELVVHSARRIADMSRFRLRYAADDQARSNQSMVNDAVLCPNCSAPLGIPDVRPIKVTCPACSVESLLMS